MPAAIAAKPTHGSRHPGAGTPAGNQNAAKRGSKSPELVRRARAAARDPRCPPELARRLLTAVGRLRDFQLDRDAHLDVVIWLCYMDAIDQGRPWSGPEPRPPNTRRHERALREKLTCYLKAAVTLQRARKARFRFERGVGDPEGLLLVTLNNVPIAFGDLNGDGAADAAVIIATNSSGSGTFVALVAVLNDGGSPAQPLPPT